MGDDVELLCKECDGKIAYPNQPPETDDIVNCAGCGLTLGVFKLVMDEANSETGELWLRIFGETVKPDWGSNVELMAQV
jgi:hypothetical protein